MSTPATHLAWPSTARTVTLDGFVPVPRGAAQTVPATLAWPAKDPADQLDYVFDISPALVGNNGDGIATLDVAITPSSAGDLTLSSLAADGSRAVLWLAAGQVGTIYTITLTIGTTSGRVLSRGVLLPVLSLSTTPVSTITLTNEFGQPLIDQFGNPILGS